MPTATRRGGILRLSSPEDAAEFDLMNELALAAEDLDKIAAALIRTGDLKILSTDIGGVALAERATRLTKAVKALKTFRAR